MFLSGNKSCPVGLAAAFDGQFEKPFPPHLLSETRGIQWPYAIINTPRRPFYELCFMHSFKSLKVEFDMSHCYFISLEANSGWVLMASPNPIGNSTKIGYYNVRNGEIVLLPDLPFVMETRLNGCFSSTPIEGKNVTMVVYHSSSSEKLLIYKHFSNATSWVSPSISMNADQNPKGHVNTKMGFMWINARDGQLYILYDWKNEDALLSWTNAQFEEQFSDCDSICTVLDEGKLYVVTLRMDGVSVYEGKLSLDPQFSRIDSLNGRNFFTVEGGTGFGLPPLPLNGGLDDPFRNQGNRIYFTSLESRDMVKFDYSPGLSRVGRGLKECAHLIDGLCGCETGWGLVDMF